MQATSKYAIFFILITFLAIEVHSEFVEHPLKKFYVERNLQLNWFEAWNYCRENNMTLISIDTALEQRLLEELLVEHFNFWTSGNELARPSPDRNNRSFVWAFTGRALQYTNWLENHLNNDGGREHCVNVWGENFKWNDDGCYKTYGFICQY